MNDVDLGKLIAFLQTHSAISRVTYNEVAEAIRKAEAAGFTFTVPAGA